MEIRFFVSVSSRPGESGHEAPRAHGKSICQFIGICTIVAIDIAEVANLKMPSSSEESRQEAPRAHGKSTC